jgi:hypothetical protein
MGTAIRSLIEWLLGIKSEQDRAIDRNRRIAEQQMAVFRDPTRQFGAAAYSKELEAASEPKWIALQREMHR